MSLPEVSQEPILHIDSIPDIYYPLRILMAYRENCNCKFVSDLDNEVVRLMNEANERRALLLDKAIELLDSHICEIRV